MYIIISISIFISSFSFLVLFLKITRVSNCWVQNWSHIFGLARRKFWSNYIVYWHFCFWFIAWFRGMNITEVLLSYHTSDGHLWRSNSTPQPKIWDQFCTQQLETRVILTEISCQCQTSICNVDLKVTNIHFVYT
jgi:hypothetical protein